MGDGGDTTLGGRGRNFPATTGGLVARFAGLETQGYRDCLGDLAQRYWKPVYTFIRIAWKKSNEDAKDLTQGFFAWLSEHDALRQYAPERGGFRPFLKTLLRHFLGHEAEVLGRLKRGGGVAPLRLEELESIDDVLADPAAADPDAIFDQAWLVTLMKVATGRLRERMAAEGRTKLFQAFEAYDLATGGERPSYGAVAERLGLKESQVRDSLHAVRKELRIEIRAELARMTRDDAELDEEWHVLFGP